ncbi:predicted protein [Chaetoceros tenuissimus]|uniref:Uncharacterized protein n=1 Tax=Chaetoceros tenuissimus TaxID=426638 RepID=A0AAD3DCL7_9STRA|nr:predicted protein [Chaetoceros tenuissimus]
MMTKTIVSRNSTKQYNSCDAMSKQIGPRKLRPSSQIMPSILMNMILMSSTAHQIGSHSSLLPRSMLPLLLLVATSGTQGCYADALPLQSLFGDAKKSDEKTPRSLRRLKKSTKSTKTDVVDPNPYEEGGDFKQVGDDIPRVGYFSETKLIVMSEDEQRFADTNNVMNLLDPGNL